MLRNFPDPIRKIQAVLLDSRNIEGQTMHYVNGSKLDKLRIDAGWSAERAADNIGIALREWFYLIKQQKKARPETLQNIAATFGVSIGEILAKWEVKEYLVVVRVEPRERQVFERLVGYGPIRRMSVIADNVARVTKTVEFSDRNGRTDPFILQYRTRNHGLISVLKPDDIRNPERNRFLAKPAHITTAFYDDGNDVTFEFDPQYPSTETLEIEVIKGYDEGHRNLTCILPNETHYETVRVTLDLASYLKNGYSVKDPRLKFFSKDASPNTSEIAEMDASVGRLIDPLKSEGSGEWRWTVGNPEPGTIYLCWELASSVSSSA